MSENVAEALQKAITEIEEKELVKEVHYLDKQDKSLPGNWLEKVVAILHKVKSKSGYTWSTKVIYIKNETPYEYLFHFGGPSTEEEITTTKDFFLGKLADIKQAKEFDFIKIESVDENTESVVLYAIKEKDQKYARIYRAQCWKTGETTFDYLIIEVKDIEIVEL